LKAFSYAEILQNRGVCAEQIFGLKGILALKKKKKVTIKGQGQVNTED
jgi:hypothetical protein